MPMSMIEIDDSLIRFLFTLDLVALFLLLTGIVWSVVRPSRRIWPPPGPRSWQYVVTWICFFAACGLNACLLFLDWNSWILAGELRFVFGVPVALLGGLLALWGVVTIGWTNSSGVRDGFMRLGPVPVHPQPAVPRRQRLLPRAEHHRELAAPLDHPCAACPGVHHHAPERRSVAERTVRRGVRTLSAGHATILVSSDEVSSVRCVTVEQVCCTRQISWSP